MMIVEAVSFIGLLLLPGIILAVIFRANPAEFLLALPLSCGLIYVLGNYSSLVDIPVGPAWYFSLVAGLIGVALVFRPAMSERNLFPSTHILVAASASAVAGGVMIFLWWRSAGHIGQLLPNHDAMYHSYVIRNIVETKSLAVEDALRLFPIGSGTSADFYPIGLHSLIALSSKIAGVSINGSMNLVTIVLAVGTFPYAMWIWCRELLGDTRAVALATPIATLMLSSVFPWSPLSWGGMPAIVALSVSPIVAVTATRVMYEPTKRGILFLSLCSLGMFSLHSTELVLVFILVFALVVRRRALPFRKALNVLLQVGFISALALAPIVAATVGGASERNLDYQTRLDVSTTLGQMLLFSFPGFVLSFAAGLFFIGVVVSNRRKETMLSAAIGILVVVVLCAARFPENVVVQVVTKPWYGQVLRLNYNIVYFAVPLIVVAISTLLMARRSKSKQILFTLTAFLMIIGSMFQMVSANSKLVDSWYNGLVPPNQNSVSAYQWLSDHLSKDEYVLTDFDGIDGSTWMYALSGARPVMYGAVTNDSRDKWRSQKTDVIANIGSLQRRPDLLRFLDLRRIRYIYFDERTNVISPQHSFSLQQLRTDAALREVFTRGNAHVFEVIS